MRLYHGTAEMNAQQIVAAGVSGEECLKFFATFDLREARDIYAPFAPDGSPRSAGVVQIDIADQLIDDLVKQALARRVEWGFYHWIVFELKAFEILNSRASFSLVPIEENDS